MKNKEHRIYELIDDYRRGKLSSEESDSLWAEMIEHPEYLEYLINSANLESIAREQKTESEKSYAAGQTEAEKSGRIYKLRPQLTRIAAIFILTAGILSTIYIFGSDYVFEPRAISDIELDTYRSSAIPEEVFDYQIQRAINHASLEEFDKALEKLDDIDRENLTENQKISLEISRGSIHYNREDYLAAERIFQNVLNEYDDMHILTEEKLHWYLGNTYLQLEDEEAALVHIRKTYELNGAYRRLAERFLD